MSSSDPEAVDVEAPAIYVSPATDEENIEREEELEGSEVFEEDHEVSELENEYDDKDSSDTLQIREPSPRPQSNTSHNFVVSSDIEVIAVQEGHVPEQEVSPPVPLPYNSRPYEQLEVNSLNLAPSTRKNSVVPSEIAQINFEEEGGPKMPEIKSILKLAGFIFVPLTILIVTMMASSFHVIEEGHVGVYFKQGALMNEYGQPGFNTKAPYITDVYEITVRPQTDTLEPIITVTKDGISNTFNEVQVISYVPQDKVISLIRKYGLAFKEALVFDRIAEELRKFCASHDIDDVYNTKFLEITGVVLAETKKKIETLSNNSVEIVNLVIPKPDIPADIAENYKQVKVQWTEQLVAKQQQATEEIKKATELMKALADANRTKDVLEIELQKEILQKEAEQNISKIQNDIVKLAEENLADIEAYKKEKEAAANKELYSNEYIQLQLAKSLTQNTKFYFSGETSPLGAIMSQILGTGKEGA